MVEVDGASVLIARLPQPFNAAKPMARLEMKTTSRNLRLRHPSAQKANATAVAGTTGSVPGWAAMLVLAAMLRVVVAGFPPVVTDEEEKLHDNPAGSPVHPRDTA
jgi:hypothetical protein